MLENIDNTKVFSYFEEISRIPRGSGNNTAISSYLVSFAKEHNLKYRQDEAENVIIWKEATKGYEDRPTVILQGHMDMVCEKELDSPHDFTSEGLELEMEGDFISAKGTTLGGDDGIAIAYALAILADDSIVHPPLEIVITTDEETGMDGAIALNPSDLKGKYFINLDSEDEGIILTSCAGGMSVNGTYAFARVKKEGYLVNIVIAGLQGGHSGTEIDKNRENAVHMLGRIMSELKRKGRTFSIVHMEGGLKDNAIPRNSKLVLCVTDQDGIQKDVQCILDMLKKEIEGREMNAKFSFSISEKQIVDIVDEEMTKNIVFFLAHVPNGVLKMSAAIPELVESSLNLGICETKDNEIFFSFSIRSSISSYKQYIGDCIHDLLTVTGGTYEQKSEYPAWEYRKDSPLRNILVDVYEKQYKEKPKIEAIHAGLECGIIAEKMPDLDMVSIGPNIYDIHTPKEALEISSTKRVYQYLLEVLRTICEK